ncbi:hypothetical protein ABI59_06865 [Acidobacteria bacterium Mor1]|nr:hypothetical protein ABI59_06865 [Acidobacteria bacterium Mor1]
MHKPFDTTRWSLVLRAAGDSPDAREALDLLLRAYWYPIYGFVRREVRDAEKARDLTQAFFLHLMEKELLKRPDPAGRFRAFLLVALKHFLAHERAREQALKRRADDPRRAMPLDDAEERWLADRTDLNPEQAFDRRWAATVIGNGLEQLQRSYVEDGKGDVFTALQGHLTGAGDPPPYAVAAQRLGLSEGAIKVAVHRMRRRLGIAMREEVAQTVADPGDVDGELRYLLSILGDDAD